MAYDRCLFVLVLSSSIYHVLRHTYLSPQTKQNQYIHDGFRGFKDLRDGGTDLKIPFSVSVCCALRLTGKMDTGGEKEVLRVCSLGAFDGMKRH